MIDIAIEDALFRIKREYKRTDGKIYLSFSGGKDSTVLAELIKMADLPTKIPFVFSNTGLEFDVITEFAKNYDYENLVVIKPRKPFGKVVKEYGFPAISKIKSKTLATYQNHVENPLEYATVRQLISGNAERKGELLGFSFRHKLAKKHFHFLHPDLEYKISNQCCEYMKKKPFHDYEKEHGMKGVFTGVRVEEGGIRASAYKSCVSIKKVRNEDFYFSMPIFDWSDDLINEFIEKYNVPVSEAYTKYGCTRTGCVGCPYSQNLNHELEMTYQFEPLRYKAALHWMKNIYMDQGVKLPFDQEYMKEFEERTEVNEKRKKEMLERFKNIRE